MLRAFSIFLILTVSSGWIWYFGIYLYTDEVVYRDIDYVRKIRRLIYLSNYWKTFNQYDYIISLPMHIDHETIRFWGNMNEYAIPSTNNFYRHNLDDLIVSLEEKSNVLILNDDSKDELLNVIKDRERSFFGKIFNTKSTFLFLGLLTAVTIKIVDFNDLVNVII